jgi:Tfp pilus assembly protein PilV
MRCSPALREQSQRARGITLIECLVYIGFSMVLLGAGLLALSRNLDNTKSLRRNVDDITRALHAGELWRMDIRAATAPIQVDANAQTIRIPTRDSEVSYRFAESQVWRKANRDAEWSSLLPKVQQSEMLLDSRTQVQACRWELELQTQAKNVRVRPLFTFLAVPGVPSQP